MAGGRFICQEFAVKARAERVKYILKLLKGNAYSYADICFKKICKDLFWDCDTEKRITINGYNRIFKPYGFAKKLINMTYKYFYIFKDETKQEIDFSICECPLDSIIIGHTDNDARWTNITVTKYNEIQNIITKQLQGDKYSDLKKEIGGLAFDCNWLNN